MEHASTRSGDHRWHMGLLVLIWCCMALLVQPVGDFPLNDDWAFAQSVETLTNKNQLMFSSWPAMTLVGQTIMGAAACKVFGFSFTVLRLLTLITGLAGVVASYLLVKTHTENKRTALFCALLLALNPLYFSLSCTFMTDVYFFTTIAFSLLFLHHWHQGKAGFYFYAAFIFMLVAISIRQTALVIPLAVAVVFLLNRRSVAGHMLIKVVAGFVVSIIFYFLLNHFLAPYRESGDYLSFARMAGSIELPKVMEHAFYRIGTLGHTLGLFLLPLTGLVFAGINRKIRPKQNITAIALTLVCCLPLIRQWTEIPSGNIFYNLGLGPQTLKDVSLLKVNREFMLGEAGLTVLRSFSMAGGIMLFYCCFTFICCRAWRTMLPGSMFLRTVSLVMAVFLFGTFIITDFFFDRYLIPLMLLLMMVLAPSGEWLKRKTTRVFILAYLLAMGLFSTLATHDYLDWNRARWSALHQLMNKGISPHEIDGGFEFNGWYQTGKVMQGQEKSWWFVDKDTYLLGFGPLPGYRVIDKIAYQKYLTLQEKYIYVLQKDTAAVK